jgi:hypothetical protein
MPGGNQVKRTVVGGQGQDFLKRRIVEGADRHTAKGQLAISMYSMIYLAI